MSRTPFFLLLAMPLLLCPMLGQNATESQTVAEIDGETITARELQQAGGASLAKLEEQAYSLKQQKLQEIIANRLLAREAHRRNISVESLVDVEITSKVGAITPEEIHNFYEANKSQLQKPEPKLQDPIRAYLRNQKLTARRQEYVKSLRSRVKVITYSEPPTPFRAEVNAGGPSRGVNGAPVTIVEFEDFQCPFCKKAQATLEQILTRYKDKVKLVHRDFPLQALHPAAWEAHEAARCAEEQGKFWEYRNLLYANAPAASPEQLNNYAGQVGIDVPVFKHCLESGKFKGAVQKEKDEGERLGVTGTPAFFINGRLLSGAQPESEFVEIIDQELAQSSTQSASALKSPQ